VELSPQGGKNDQGSAVDDDERVDGIGFYNDDLVSQISFVDDYAHEFTTGDEDSLLYIRSVPNDGVPVVWAAIVTAIEADGYLPVWEHYYDEKDQIVRSFLFAEPKTFGERRIPTVLSVIPGKKDGNKTVLIYHDMEFDIDIESDVFTLRHLRSTK